MTFFNFLYNNLKNVSCEYNRVVVETQLCKLRDTSDTLIGRACATVCSICNIMTFVNYTYDMVADNQFHMFYSMVGRLRVFYIYSS